MRHNHWVTTEPVFEDPRRVENEGIYNQTRKQVRIWLSLLALAPTFEAKENAMQKRKVHTEALQQVVKAVEKIYMIFVQVGKLMVCII